jgi:glutamate synthase domain-containing protein 2
MPLEHEADATERAIAETRRTAYLTALDDAINLLKSIEIMGALRTGKDVCVSALECFKAEKEEKNER